MTDLCHAASAYSLYDSLRLYPALPYMERTAVEGDVIPLRKPVQHIDGRVVTEIPVSPGQVASISTVTYITPLKRSQVVIIPIISIHRSDSIWPDPDTFRPERWLDKLPPNDELCSGWANGLAFSDGPRNCVGLRLGE